MTDALTAETPAPAGPWPHADLSTPVQLLSPSGERRDHPDLGPVADLLTDTDLRAMYRHMVLTRAVDAAGVALQRQGELALWAPCLGQEGAQVGSATAATGRDMIFPSYREHGVASVRGLDLRRLFPVMRGHSHGGWDPRELDFHTYTFVLAAQLPHAAGYAMGLQRDGSVGTGEPEKNRAVLAYIGDGAMTEGDAHEAFVFATSAQAPLVTVCQNNQWAISVPVSTQTRVPLARRAAGYGMPAIRVDGNDVLASYAATHLALEHARGGGGPVFVEAVTYRLGAHTTSDDPTRYRTREEEDSWRARCPIDRLRLHLSARDLLDQDAVDALEEEAADLSAQVRAHVRSLPPVQPQEMFENVYVLEHAQVEADRAAWAALEAQFEDSALSEGGQR